MTLQSLNFLDQHCPIEYNVSHAYNFTFSNSCIKKRKKNHIGEINCGSISYLMKSIQNISTYNQFKIINKYIELFSLFYISETYTFITSHLGIATFHVLNSHLWLMTTTVDGPAHDYIWSFLVWKLFFKYICLSVFGNFRTISCIHLILALWHNSNSVLLNGARKC